MNSLAALNKTSCFERVLGLRFTLDLKYIYDLLLTLLEKWSTHCIALVTSVKLYLCKSQIRQRKWRIATASRLKQPNPNSAVLTEFKINGAVL